ncbi:HupE/UreJ family protein, partial [Streptomyces sp. NPDC047072]|uniref:HupE/UreJ family protein n=1 Tax=Streptomyces sp. NPDC047072 TaxID=3154809 RepID=UPI0033C1CF3A
MTRPRNWPAALLRLVAGIAFAVPAALLLGASPAAAHPMPHSVVQLDVYKDSVSARLELPVGEFTRASGIDVSEKTLGARTGAIRAYLVAHIRPTATDGSTWQVAVGRPTLGKAVQTDTGEYRELVVRATLTPPPGIDVRHFTFGYDVIVHQVVTHTVLVTVRQDWAAGQVDGAGTTQVGTIRVDTRTMKVPALKVDLGAGSAWRGFVAMVELGGDHILTGTDHLLFLLILLLPAPLAASGGRGGDGSGGGGGGVGPGRWGGLADGRDEGRGLGRRRGLVGGRDGDRGPARWDGLVGARTALARIGCITLAFTAGHSVALAVTAIGRLDIPAWPVEAFIAVSILVGAVHAIRPLFPGKEALVAGVFGLGHGMAFSFVLAELHLSTGQLVTSLLGFNLGIELVQLLLVCLALPSL